MVQLILRIVSLQRKSAQSKISVLLNLLKLKIKSKSQRLSNLQMVEVKSLLRWSKVLHAMLIKPGKRVWLTDEIIVRIIVIERPIKHNSRNEAKKETSVRVGGRGGLLPRAMYGLCILVLSCTVWPTCRSQIWAQTLSVCRLFLPRESSNFAGQLTSEGRPRANRKVIFALLLICSPSDEHCRAFRRLPRVESAILMCH